MTSRSYFGKMNSILGSVVPLVMFILIFIFILDRWTQVRKFISRCFSRDEKAEWVYETKTNMKGEKIYSHTMCLPCHK